jgi:hypothetical protein
MKEYGVKYGNQVQLLHLNSNKFLGISSKDHASYGYTSTEVESEAGGVQFKLVSKPSWRTIFCFQNSYKYQAEGENFVFYESPIY